MPKDKSVDRKRLSSSLPGTASYFSPHKKRAECISTETRSARSGLSCCTRIPLLYAFQRFYHINLLQFKIHRTVHDTGKCDREQKSVYETADVDISSEHD